MKTLYDSLLRASGTDAEVAEILYPVAGLGPVDDAGDIFALCKEEMHKLIYASLDFTRFKDDGGDFLNIIPEGLGFDLKDRLEEEYQDFLNALDMKRMIEDAEERVLGRVEEYAWKEGIRVLPEALEKMMSCLAVCASEYGRMTGPVDDADLLAAYKAAQKNTLLERISASNSDDILAYRQELVEYLEKACAVRMYGVFERFFSILSCSSVFMRLKAKIEGIREYILGQGAVEENVAAPEYAGVQGVVFTDLEETDPEKALGEYARLLNNN